MAWGQPNTHCNPQEPVMNSKSKPKAYHVTEVEIIDAEAYKALGQAVSATEQQDGFRILTSAFGRVVPFVGEPPKNVGIAEFDSLDQLMTYRNSQGFKDLGSQRDKAFKIIRQYAVEAAN
jgi:uncharacterized protein (DUF1330 family)